MRLIGKLQDGTVFVKKGHGDNEDDLFEFKTDEGMHLQFSLKNSNQAILMLLTSIIFTIQSKLSRG